MRAELREPLISVPLMSAAIFSFETDAFTAPRRGPVRAILYASTDGVDTDFMAKLSVIKADNRVMNLVDGVQGPLSGGLRKEVLMAPGGVSP